MQNRLKGREGWLRGHWSNPGKKLHWLRSSEFKVDERSGQSMSMFEDRANDTCWHWMWVCWKDIKVYDWATGRIELPFTEMGKRSRTGGWGVIKSFTWMI